MDLVGADELLALAEDGGGPRVSLFCPTHRSGPQTATDRIRWKNLVQSVERGLRADGTPAATIDALLGSARDLLRDDWFWEHNSDGLALLAGTDRARLLRVPVRLPELAAVGNRCLIGPLLPMLTSDGRFFILGLSHDDVRLFEATRFAIDEVAVEGLPLAPWSTLPRQRRQTHAFVADRGGSGAAAVFHGAGTDTDRKRVLAQHFHLVDAALRHTLAADRTPVVLAAVGYVQALYREANSHPTLLGEGISGSPRDLALDELHRRGWAIAEPVLRAEEARAAASFAELAGTGRTLDDPAEAGQAARDGRVATLFVSADETAWRAPGTGQPLVRLDAQRTVGELLDLAAVDTLRHGGAVYAVPADRMPAPGPVAGVLRY